MAQVPQYVAQGSAETGPVGVLAGPEAFGGAAAGAGLRDLASGIAQVGDVLEKRKQQQELVWVNDTITQAQDYWMKEMDRRQKEAPLGAPDFTPTLTKDYEKFVSDQLKAAPSRTTAVALRQDLGHFGLQLEKQSMEFEAHQRLLKTTADLETSNNRAEAAVFRDPSMLDALSAQQTTAIQAGGKGRLPQSTLQTLNHGATVQLFQTALASYEANDKPEEGLKLLDNKQYDGLIDGRVRAAWVDKYNRQIEQKILKDRAAIEEAHKSNIEQIRSTGKAIPSYDLELTSKLIPRAAQDVQMAYQFYAGKNVIENGDPQYIAKSLEALRPQVITTPNYGLREDGTPKGPGFFGELQRPGGDISTEISIGVPINGKETSIPTLVPTLTEGEKKSLLSLQPGEKPSPEIVKKATEYAQKRQSLGLSPFVNAGETVYVNPKTLEPALSTTPGAVNFATGNPPGQDLSPHEQGQVYAELVKLAEKEFDLRQKDPAGAADRTTELMKLNADYAAEQDPAKAALLQQQIYASRLAWQSSVGIPKFAQRVISLEDARQFSDRLRKGSAVERQAAWLQLEQQTGNHFGEVVSALQQLPAGERLPGKDILLGLKADTPEGKRLAVALNNSDKVLNEGMTPSDVQLLRNKVATQTGMTNLKDALYAVGGERGQFFNDYLDATEAYAKQLRLDKVSGDPASIAVEHLINKEFSFGSSPNGRKFFIPVRNPDGTSFSPEDLARIKQRLTSDYSAILKSENYAIDVYGGKFPGLSAEYYAPRIADALASRSIWVNNAKNDGVELYMDLTGDGNYLQVFDKAHQPIYRNFQQVSSETRLEPSTFFQRVRSHF